MFRLHRLMRSAGKVARVNRNHAEDIVAQISRATDDSDLLIKCIETAVGLNQSNQLSAKEMSLLMHQLGKSNCLLHASEKAGQFITELTKKLSRAPKLASHLTPLDISLFLNGLAKVCKDIPSLPSHTVTKLTQKISQEIPLKLSLFEDHQLAQVLHALASLRFTDQAIIMELVNEIETARDVSSFNLQSIVMLSSSVSRLVTVKPENTTLNGFWTSIMKKIRTVQPSDMQPNWPDVILSSVAHSGLDKNLIPKKFIENVVACIEKQAIDKTIPIGRVLKSVDALLRIGCCPQTVSKLGKLCR